MTHAWLIPSAIMVAILLWAFLKPMPKAGGDYDFVTPFTIISRAAVCLIVMLAAWLVYFMVRSLG